MTGFSIFKKQDKKTSSRLFTDPRVLGLFPALLFSGLVIAQKNTASDSLLSLANKEENDSVKIELLLKTGDFLEYSQPDSALYYYHSALEQAQSNGRKSLEAKSMRYIGLIHLARIETDKAMAFLSNSLEIYSGLNDKKGMSACFDNIATIYYWVADYDMAIENYLNSVNLKQLIVDECPDDTNCVKNLTGSIMNVGNVYYATGVYDKSIEYYQKAMETAGRINEEMIVGQCNSNIGLVHSRNEAFDKAIEYYLDALAIFTKLGNTHSMSNCILNLGSAYSSKKDFNAALEYYNKALEMKISINDKKGISDCYTGIGLVYRLYGAYDKALEYNIMALGLKKEIGDRAGTAMVLGNISGVYIEMADSVVKTPAEKQICYSKAIQFGLEGIAIAREINTLLWIKDISRDLSIAYSKTGNFTKAYEYDEIYISANDSLYKEEKARAIVEMELRYQAVKKQLQIETLQKEQVLQKEIIAQKEQKNKRQRLIIYISVIGLIVLFTLSILILRLFIHKRKANKMITERNEALQTAVEEINAQKEEISAQRDEIESQRDLVVEQKDKIEIINKEMTDSIYYAKRIQSAMLLSQENRSALLGNHFVFFLPRDIVSGDFYWGTQINNWLIITVADCTGHGVPGAFMSMLGISFLNEIVRKKEVTNAAQVLNELRDAVIDALKQTDDYRELREWLAKTSSVKDGMDISLIAIDKDTGKCQWAGANSPLYIVREQTLPTVMESSGSSFSEKPVPSTEHQGVVLYEMKGDNMPVAIHLKMEQFTNHGFQLIENDRIYLFTDGFPDQFGGPKGKKFLYSRFKALILETAHADIAEQGKQIENAYYKWVGSDSNDHYKQTDDITVVGIKI